MLVFRQRRAERGISLCGRQGRLRVGCWMRRGRRPHRHLRPGLLYTIYLHRNTIYLLTHMLAFISPLLYQGFLSVSIVKRSRTTPKSIIYRERSSKVAQTHYQKAISATKLLIHQYQEIKCNIAQIDRSQIRVESRIEEPESSSSSTPKHRTEAPPTAWRWVRYITPAKSTTEPGNHSQGHGHLHARPSDTTCTSLRSVGIAAAAAATTTTTTTGALVHTRPAISAVHVPVRVA